MLYPNEPKINIKLEPIQRKKGVRGMLLSHHLTVEQKAHVKEMKKMMKAAKTSEERKMLEKQLNSFIERLFLEYKLRRRNEL
ncbi:hypothetical protein ACFOU2_22895 [Bacillus songklensis]|uniref:Uncharacterized protein n=1 Tax=Bacillus songklensis TaxID=1069116 RepID=A0ABV8B9M0_9BACI